MKPDGLLLRGKQQKLETLKSFLRSGSSLFLPTGANTDLALYEYLSMTNALYHCVIMAVSL